LRRLTRDRGGGLADAGQLGTVGVSLVFGSFGAGAQVGAQFVTFAGGFGTEFGEHSFGVGAGSVGLGAGCLPGGLGAGGVLLCLACLFSGVGGELAGLARSASAALTRRSASARAW
jgi:hypothetical protein